MFFPARASLAILGALHAQQVAGTLRYDTTVCDQKSYTSSENMTCTPSPLRPCPSRIAPQAVRKLMLVASQPECLEP